MINTKRSILLGLAMAVCVTTPAISADTSNPNWPCVQRKVETLTSAQIWDGPPVDEIKNWWEDREIGKLARYVITRRVSMEEVEQAIEKFANTIPEGKERDKKLTILFAGVLDETNTVRKRIMNSIELFQSRQLARAAELEREGTQLAELHKKRQAGTDVSAELAKAQKEYDWNARIFKEREEAVPVACEIPVDIEQRAFAVGRTIRFHMS
ncbi:MAG: hypothetical protein RIC14_04465 [Filomicrobium sp.]